MACYADLACVLLRVKRISGLPVGGSGFGDGARGGAGTGDKSNDPSKPISTQLKAGANVEFGKVQTQAVGDASDLRKRLAASK